MCCKIVYFTGYHLNKLSMKKTFALLLLTFLSVSLFAQKFGVRAGLNFSNASISNFSPTVSTGLNAGIFLNFHVAAVVSIQPELAYSSMGYKVSVSGVDSSNVTNYLALPVLLRVKLPLTGLCIYAGPQYSILLSANRTASGVSTDVKENYKSGDFSAVGGIEYSLPFGLFGTVRYQAGLSNVSNNPTIDTQKNTAVTVLVGFKF